MTPRLPPIVSVALSVAGAAAVFAPMTLFRFLDGDEGDYAAAAGLVIDGEVLYRDFLYTQTPLLPYVYGVWGMVTGERWLGLRALSLVLSLLLALLVHAHLRRRVDETRALVGVALLVASSLSFTWYPTVKTYALSTLLLFGAYMLLERRHTAPAAAALSGTLAALSIQTRSLLIGGALVLGWAAWKRGMLSPYLAGCLLGSLPSVLFLAVDADGFLFGNLWYHGARSEGGLVGDFEQKLAIVANLLGIPTESRPLPQYGLLLIGVAVTLAMSRRARGDVPLALWVAAGLAVVALLPTPTYSQYFATTVPFLVVAVMNLTAHATADHPSRSLATIGAVALATYLLIAPVELRHLVVSSKEDRPTAVQRVADGVAARVEPGDEVAASWVGYVYGTGARPLRGLENAFAPHEAAALTLAEAERYHVASAEDVESAIRGRRVSLVVVKVWHDLEPIPAYERAARDGRYDLIATIETVRIYGLARGSASGSRG